MITNKGVSVLFGGVCFLSLLGPAILYAAFDRHLLGDSFNSYDFTSSTGDLFIVSCLYSLSFAMFPSTTTVPVVTITTFIALLVLLVVKGSMFNFGHNFEPIFLFVWFSCLIVVPFVPLLHLTYRLWEDSDEFTRFLFKGSNYTNDIERGLMEADQPRESRGIIASLWNPRFDVHSIQC
jgi:hypothetical protein